MSDKTLDQNAGGSATDDKGSADVSQNSNEINQELETLRKKNSELLSEKRAISEKLKLFEKEKLDQEEKAKKERGDFESLFKSEKEKNLSLALKMKTKICDAQVKDAFRKLGCTDEKKLGVLMGFESVKNYHSQVKFNEDYDADLETLNDFTSKVKSEFSEFGFFSKEAGEVKDVLITRHKEKELSQMSSQEREALKLKLLQEKN